MCVYVAAVLVRCQDEHQEETANMTCHVTRWRHEVQGISRRQFSRSGQEVSGARERGLLTASCWHTAQLLSWLSVSWTSFKSGLNFLGNVEAGYTRSLCSLPLSSRFLPGFFFLSTWTFLPLVWPSGGGASPLLCGSFYLCVVQRRLSPWDWAATDGQCHREVRSGQIIHIQASE